MLSFKEYLTYWPVLAGGLVFFGLGLCIWRVSESAMERSPKPFSWVGDYRKPGFPFRPERLPADRQGWKLPVLLAVLAALFVLFTRVNAGKIALQRWMFVTGRQYDLFLCLCGALGAASVWFLLLLLFNSRYAALLGTLLFLFSPLQNHAVVCLLAASCLCLLLYLRAERPAFPTELLYLAALLFYALAFAFQPVLLWLFPCFVGLHWFKLGWQLQHVRLDSAGLILSAAAALAAWFVFGILSAVGCHILRTALRPEHILKLLTPLRIRYACSELWQAAREEAFTPLMRNRLLEPLLDAPVFGLGLWGCFSAAGMAFKRRRVQGWFLLDLTLVLVLVWLCSGSYLLTLPLSLAVGSMAKNAETGGSRRLLTVAVALGIAFSIGILFAAWALPLVTPLSWRLF